MKPAIVVTGASLGIGRELARVAAREGSIMVLLGQSQQALDDLVAKLGSSGAQAHAFCFDLADRDAGQQIENALSELGVYCDVLVNSAGFGVFGPAAEIDREEQLKLLDVNAHINGAYAPLPSRHGRQTSRRHSQCRLYHGLCAGTEYGRVLRIKGLCEIVYGSSCCRAGGHGRNCDLSQSRRDTNRFF